MTRRRWRALAAAGLLTVFSATVDSPAEATPRATTTQAYEVWVTDAAENELLVYPGMALEDGSGPRNEADVIDLAALFDLSGPNNTTGLAVSGPQTVDASPDGRHVAVAFAESGHVAIFDAKTHQPKALILPSASRRGRLTTAASEASPVSSARWLADGSAIVLANQGTKRVERINYDAITDSFAFDGGAALDLVRCTTPSNKPCQSPSSTDPASPGFFGPDNRPDTTPVCVVATGRGHVLVTMVGGGLFVIDPSATPMHMVAAYGNQYVGRDACGGAQTDRFVHLAGDTATASDPFQYSMYQIRDNYPRAPRTIIDNEPQRAPKLFWRSPDGTMMRHTRAMAIAGAAGALWNLERSSGLAEVFSTTSLTRVSSVPLAGDLLDEARPVAAAASPDGRRLYILLGGSMPFEKGAGQPLGLGILAINPSGTGGSLTELLATAEAQPMVEHPIEEAPSTDDAAPTDGMPTEDPMPTDEDTIPDEDTPSEDAMPTDDSMPMDDTPSEDTMPDEDTPSEDAMPTEDTASMDDTPSEDPALTDDTMSAEETMPEDIVETTTTTRVRRSTTTTTPTRQTLSASGATITTRKATATTFRSLAATSTTRRAAAPTTSTRKRLGIVATSPIAGSPTKLAARIPAADLVARSTTIAGRTAPVAPTAARPTVPTTPATVKPAGSEASDMSLPAEPGGMAVVMTAKG
ncbi:MAG: hypothetical protein R2761_03070 [Acidimicrobiales bacterium]